MPQRGFLFQTLLPLAAFPRRPELRARQLGNINGHPNKRHPADEWVWYEANEAGGRDLLYWAAAQLAAVFIPLAFLRPASWTTLELDRAGVVYLAIILGVQLLGLLIVCVVSYVRANRLLRERIASGAMLMPCINT